MFEESPVKFKHSRIVKQLEPSLSHMETVQIAFQFLKEFDIEILETAFAEIEHQLATAFDECARKGECTKGITVRSNRLKETLFIPGSSRNSVFRAVPEIQQQYISASDEYSENNSMLKFNKLKEALLSMTRHLRSNVLDAVRGMHQDFLEYQEEHPFVEVDKCSLHLKADGTIDRKKMARQIASDGSLDIRKRYHTACMYNIFDMIPNLFIEMDASGYLQDIIDPERTILIFSLPDGGLIPWIQLPPPARGVWYPRFSECFRFIQKLDRENTITFIRNFLDVDLLQLMRYVVTKKEEEEILKTEARRILCLHLKWPLQRLFLPTAEKMWAFLDVQDFHFLLKELLLLKDLEEEGLKEDYDYAMLFEEFWNKSPSHLKESVKDNRHLNRRINACFGEGKKKRKANMDERTNSKKKAKEKCKINK